MSYPPGVTQRDIDEAAGAYDEWQRCTVCGQMRDSPCREGDCGNEITLEDAPANDKCTSSVLQADGMSALSDREIDEWLLGMERLFGKEFLEEP